VGVGTHYRPAREVPPGALGTCARPAAPRRRAALAAFHARGPPPRRAPARANTSRAPSSARCCRSSRRSARRGRGRAPRRARAPRSRPPSGRLRARGRGRAGAGARQGWGQCWRMGRQRGQLAACGAAAPSAQSCIATSQPPLPRPSGPTPLSPTPTSSPRHRLLHSLAACPIPTSPRWTTLVPIAESSGRAAATASPGPPTWRAAGEGAPAWADAGWVRALATAAWCEGAVAWKSPPKPCSRHAPAGIRDPAAQCPP
jgi:hypothetical protein